MELVAPVPREGKDCPSVRAKRAQMGEAHEEPSQSGRHHQKIKYSLICLGKHYQWQIIN